MVERAPGNIGGLRKQPEPTTPKVVPRRRLAPRALRAGLEKWWKARLASRAPLAVVAVAIDSTSLPEHFGEWALTMLHLRPWVRTAVFATYVDVYDEAEKLGLDVFGSVDKLPSHATGLEEDKGFGKQQVKMMMAHLMTEPWGGGREKPAFFGVIEPGTLFPDAAAIVDTLYGVAADIQQQRLPPNVVLMARTRIAETFSGVKNILHGFLKERPGTDEWAALETQVLEMAFEPQEDHSMVMFTADAVEWDLHGGLAAITPTHVAALVREKRLTYAAATTDPEKRMVATMGASSVVDITDTAFVVRAPLGRGTIRIKPPPHLVTAEGAAIPTFHTDQAELATFVEEVEVSPGVIVDFSGHIVVGWRGPVRELEDVELVSPNSNVQEPTGDVNDRPAEPPLDGGPKESEGYEFEKSQVALLHVFTTLISRDRSDPHGEQKYTIQRNTLMALSFLAPKVEVTVFTDSDQVRALCDELGDGVVCSEDFKSNQHGTPLLKSMYLTVERDSDARMYGYINADILFDDGLVQAIETVLRGIEDGVLHSRVLVIGQRINFPMPYPFPVTNQFSLQKRSDLKKIKQMAARGRLFQTDAEDFFFITKGAFVWSKMPDFVIGRPAYDNWIVDHAYHDGLDRVDVTPTVHAVHQNDIKGDKAGHDQSRPDVEWNKALIARNGGGGYDHGLTTSANWATSWHMEGQQRVMKLVARPQLHSPGRPSHLKHT